MIMSNSDTDWQYNSFPYNFLLGEDPRFMWFVRVRTEPSNDPVLVRHDTSSTHTVVK